MVPQRQSFNLQLRAWDPLQIGHISYLQMLQMSLLGPFSWCFSLPLKNGLT